MSKQAVPLPIVLQNHELRLQRIEAAISLDEDKSVAQLSVVPPAPVQEATSAPSQRSGGSSSSRTADLARRRAAPSDTTSVTGGAAATSRGAPRSAASGAGASPAASVPTVPSFDYLKGRVLSAISESSAPVSSSSVQPQMAVDSEELTEMRTQLGDVDARTMDLRTEVDGMAKTLLLVNRENIELRQEIRRMDGQRVKLEAEVEALREIVSRLVADSKSE